MDSIRLEKVDSISDDEDDSKHHGNSSHSSQSRGNVGSESESGSGGEKSDLVETDPSDPSDPSDGSDINDVTDVGVSEGLSDDQDDDSDENEPLSVSMKKAKNRLTVPSKVNKALQNKRMNHTDDDENDNDENGSSTELTDVTSRGITLLDAAELVLKEAGRGGLHIKDIQSRCAELHLIDPAKEKSLDALIYRETQRGSERFTRVDGHPGFFTLATEEDKVKMLQRKADRAEKVRLERHRKKASHERKLRYLKKTVRVMLFTNTAMHEELKSMKQAAKNISRTKRQLMHRLKLKGESIPEYIKESEASEGDDEEDLRREKARYHQRQMRAMAKAAASKAHTGAGFKLAKKRKPAARSTKVVDVECDNHGVPVQPFKAGPITVESLGNVEYDREGYHSERYIWPIGFTSNRLGNSYLDVDRRVIYTCTIVDGGAAPLFEIKAEDDPEHPIVASSPTSANVTLLNMIKKARTGEVNPKLTASGPAFFGLSNPYVMKALTLLPNTDKLKHFNPNYLDQQRSERDSRETGEQEDGGDGAGTRHGHESLRGKKKRRISSYNANRHNSEGYSRSGGGADGDDESEDGERTNKPLSASSGGGRDHGVSAGGDVSVREKVTRSSKKQPPKLSLSQKLMQRRKPTNKRANVFV
eukprot:CFRG8278T1